MNGSAEDLVVTVETLFRESDSVIIPTKGNSMRPFIRGGDNVLLVRVGNPLKVGIIILARTLDKRVVLHRIIGINGDYLTLMGDGNLKGTERCRKSEVIAVAQSVVGHKSGLYTRKNMLGWWLWYWLRPIRNLLLSIQSLFT